MTRNKIDNSQDVIDSRDVIERIDGVNDKNETRISQVIRSLVREFGEHPYDINDGRCGEFADRVVELVPSAGVWDLGIEHGHVCVKCDGRYYDAEEPEGVKHWRQLPIIVRNRRAA